MLYIVSWMEYDESLKRDLEWTTYFERYSEVEKFMREKLDEGRKNIKINKLNMI